MSPNADPISSSIISGCRARVVRAIQPHTEAERHSLLKFLAISRSRIGKSAPQMEDREQAPADITSLVLSSPDYTKSTVDAAQELLLFSRGATTSTDEANQTRSPPCTRHSNTSVKIKLRGIGRGSILPRKSNTKLFRLHHPTNRTLHNRHIRPIGILKRQGVCTDMIVVRFSNGIEDGNTFIVNRSLIRHLPTNNCS